MVATYGTQLQLLASQGKDNFKVLQYDNSQPPISSQGAIRASEVQK